MCRTLEPGQRKSDTEGLGAQRDSSLGEEAAGASGTGSLLWVRGGLRENLGVWELGEGEVKGGRIREGHSAQGTAGAKG